MNIRYQEEVKHERFSCKDVIENATFGEGGRKPLEQVSRARRFQAKGFVSAQAIWYV